METTNNEVPLYVLTHFKNYNIGINCNIKIDALWWFE